MYSIFRQQTTGLWAVGEDATGKIIARGDNPNIAINVAISKGMPPENREGLEADALVENERELKQAEAANAKAEATLEDAQDQQTEQQNTQFLTEDGADDDSGDSTTYYESDGTASTSDYNDDDENEFPDTTDLGGDDGSSYNNDTYYENNGTSSSSIGTTVAGKSGTGKAKREKKPTRRLHNPLGDYSSYTYQITLYMITPDAYNAFIESGRKNINAFATAGNAYAQESYENTSSGVYIVAQSGGINNTTSHRAPGFDLDYYIDNLEISQAVAMGKSENNSGPTNTVDVKFQVTEPYGFSFITKLKTAQDALQKVSKLPNVDKNPFADRQTYILGIKFLGYDAQGNIITGPGKNFETFYDIQITGIKFKLDGRAVVYSVTGCGVAISQGMGLKNGRILTDTSAVGGTVGEMIDSLVENLNKYQQNQVENDSIGIANEYEVVYVGPDADLIKYSSVVNMAADADKTKYPALTAVTTDKITAKDSFTSPDKTKRQLAFKGAGSTSILDAIQSIVKQSDYIQKSIINLYANVPEPDQDTDEYETADVDSKRVLKWINVSNEVINLGYDEYKKDWAYKIRYIVQSYEAPAINVVQAGKVPKYYGPAKRYSYWLTGKNTEVTRFEMEYNTLYTQVAVGNLADQDNKISPIPIMVGHRVDEQRQGRTGVALESQNAYINYLNDPGAYASAKLTILGDPDWLMQENASSLNEIYDKFYGTNGYTINCNSGQVFIEVDFKEAIDYNNNTGVMSINDKLLFFKYPEEYTKGPDKIQGIAFTVTQVVSNFRGGKFEQTLTCNANIWDTISSNTNQSTDSSAAGRETDNSYDRAEANRLANTGFKKAPPEVDATPTPSALDEFGNEIPQYGTNQTTPKGVADDDMEFDKAWQQDYFGIV